MEIVDGNLITLAKAGEFDVIVHGCNCFCTMGAGIAPQMVEAFGVDELSLEDEWYKGDIDKLGRIQYGIYPMTETLINLAKSTGRKLIPSHVAKQLFNFPKIKQEDALFVVNAYTQYNYGINHLDGTKSPLDYEAFSLCMRKINHEFKGKHVGLPKIGCGLAGGDWDIVKDSIEVELRDCKVTIINYKP